jgi:phosphonate transport system substrate-binding protein
LFSSLRQLYRLAILCCLLGGPLLAAAQPLVLGILPFKSPVALFKQFAPLRDYLAEQLGRPVLLETASNYAEFITRTRQRHYDLVFTAPHFTLLALDHGNYTLSATLTNPLQGVIVVPPDSPIRELAQLAGRTIATPPRSAIITRASRLYLEQQGLNGERMPRYRTFQSHNASLLATVSGQTVGGIASINTYRQSKLNLRLLATTPPLPSMGMLAARDLPEELQRRFIQVLISMDDSVRGRTALAKMGYPGFRQARPAEFEALRPFLEPVADGN